MENITQPFNPLFNLGNVIMPQNIPIQFRKLYPNAQVPIRGSTDAAGFDLVSANIDSYTSTKRVIVGTGIACAFPPGYVLLIYGRSGLAFKHGIRLTNSVGVIDADYRGEIKLSFSCDEEFEWSHQWCQHLLPGARVAQAILTKIPGVQWDEAKEALPDTIRGTGGFGSTGAT